MVLTPLRRRAEQHAAMTQAEAIARTLGDPVSIAQVLQLRADQESFLGRLDVAEPFADAALDLAMTARDDWVIARAAYTQALVAPAIAELRKRVDRAASLLAEAGNVYQLAGLLAGAAGTRRCARQRARRQGVRRPRACIRAGTGRSVHLDGLPWQPRAGGAANRRH